MDQVDTNLTDRFSGLRDLAFAMNREEIGLPTEEEPFIMVMDQFHRDGAMSLVAFSNGDAGLFHSSGTEVVGGGRHLAVARAVRQYFEEASRYLSGAKVVRHTNLPGAGEVHFYFRTARGNALLKEPLNTLENGISQMSGLFYAATAVIAELESISGENQRRRASAVDFEL